MTSDTPLLVDQPSNRRIPSGPDTGGSAKALPGLPERGTLSASGSNSYGDCRHCPSTWALTDGLVPRHADRRIRETGSLRRVCQGSLEAPVSYLEA